MNHYSDIILGPVITEKTTELNSKNVYVFKVNKKATKNQIKRAFEEAFKIKVEKVNTLITKPKKKRVGKYSGMTKTFKKAIVTLKEGQTLEI